MEGDHANVDSLLTVFREHRELTNLLEHSETYLMSLKSKLKSTYTCCLNGILWLLNIYLAIMYLYSLMEYRSIGRQV